MNGNGELTITVSGSPSEHEAEISIGGDSWTIGGGRVNDDGGLTFRAEDSSGSSVELTLQGTLDEAGVVKGLNAILVVDGEEVAAELTRD